MKHIKINIEVYMNIEGETNEEAIFNASTLFHDRTKLGDAVSAYFGFAPQEVIEDQVVIEIDDCERYKLEDYSETNSI